MSLRFDLWIDRSDIDRSSPIGQTGPIDPQEAETTARRVGRPRRFDPDRVVDAAMVLFWEQGYEATSLAQLRAATGLSSASLYGAFGSKAGLFARVVEHYVAGPGRVTEVAADETLRPREALGRMLHGSIEMQSDPSHPPGCLIALSATVGPQDRDGDQARAVVAARRAADRQRIAACLQRGVASGEFPDAGGVEAPTAMVHGFLLGTSTQLRDGVPPERIHAAADALLGVLSTTAA